MTRICRLAAHLNVVELVSARVAVIGLGYVSLPLAIGFAQAGFETAAFDVNQGKEPSIGACEGYIGGRGVSGGHNMLARLRQGGSHWGVRFSAYGFNLRSRLG